MGGVGGAQHLDGFKGGVAGGVERCGRCDWSYMASKAAAAERGLGAAAAYGEVLDIADGEGGDFAFEGARDVGAEGDGAEGGVGSACGEGLLLAVRG